MIGNVKRTGQTALSFSIFPHGNSSKSRHPINHSTLLGDLSMISHTHNCNYAHENRPKPHPWTVCVLYNKHLAKPSAFLHMVCGQLALFDMSSLISLPRNLAALVLPIELYASFLISP